MKVRSILRMVNYSGQPTVIRNITEDTYNELTRNKDLYPKASVEFFNAKEHGICALIARRKFSRHQLDDLKKRVREADNKPIQII